MCFLAAARRHPQSSPPCPGEAAAHVVLQVAVAAGLGQQQLDDLHVPMLTGAHQGGGALVVLDVHIRPAGQQALHHVYPPVADRQHEGRLSCLRRETAVSFRSAHRASRVWPMGWGLRAGLG